MVAGRRLVSAGLGSAGAIALVAAGVSPELRSVWWFGATALVSALCVALVAERPPAVIAPVASPSRENLAQDALPEMPQECGDAPVEVTEPVAPIAPTGVEPSDALEAFVSAAGDVGELVSAHLWLLDPATRTMRLVTAFGDMRPNADPMHVESSTVGEAAQGGVAVLRADARRVMGGSEQLIWRYAVPLRVGDALGSAAIDFVADSPASEILNRAAAATRGVLSAALALHVSRTETAGANALLSAAREILGLVDAERIVASTLDHALALSSADTGSVMLLEEDSREMTIRAASGLPERVVAGTRVAEGEGISGWVLTTRKSAVVEDLDDKGPRSRRHGIRSAMAVPIMDSEGILGVLNVGSRRFHARFSASQLASLESLGQVLGLALRNAAAHESARELYLETVRALALAMETKDPYSRGSTDRVFDLAETLGAAMALTDEEQQGLRVAALLHDIGMAAAGDLASTGERPLSTIEWAMLKMHPVIAADVLDQASSLRTAVPIVYHHHEHYNGQGYVLGLCAEQIPIGARVLSVADAYVAMTSPRSYRAAKSRDEAVAELIDKAGSQFDPSVVAALVEHLGSEDRTRT